MSDSLAGLSINVDVTKVKAAIAALDALAKKAGEVETKVNKATSGGSSASSAAASATARQTQQIIAYEKRLESATKKHVDFINTLNGSGVGGLSRSNAIAEAERAFNRLNSVVGQSRTLTLEGSRALRQYDNDMKKLNLTTQSNVSLNRQRASEMAKDAQAQARALVETNRAVAASRASQIATERALQAAQTSTTGIIGRANRQLPAGAAGGITAQAVRDLQTYSQAIQQFGRNSVEGATAQGIFNRAMQTASGRINEQGGLIRTLNDNTKTLNSAFGGASNSVGGFGRVIFQTSAAIASLTGAFALREITQSIMEFERFSNTLRTVSGSSGEFSRNMSFLNAEADRIGFSIGEVGNSFARFSLAMTGAGFSSDQVRGSFSQLAEASRNLGLSSADTTGIIRALEQSMSKGKFMAEEVRLQLGDRLPFAMQALTRAVTQVDGRVSDINKRFEEGTLDVARYGVEFIRQINLMSGGAEALSRTSNTAAAAFGRLGTEFLRTTTAFGEAGFNNAVIIFSNNLERLLEFSRNSGFLKVLAEGLLIAAQNMDLFAIALGTFITLLGSRALMGFVAIIMQLNPVVRGVTIALGALAAAYNLVTESSNGSARSAQNFNASLANINTIAGRVSENIQNYQNLLTRGKPLTDSSATAIDQLVSANMRLGKSFEAATAAAAAHYADINRLALEQARREQEIANRNLQGFLAGNPAISNFSRASRIRAAESRSGLTLQPGQESTNPGVTLAQEGSIQRYLEEYTSLRASFQATVDGIKAEFGTNIPAYVTRLLLSLAQLEESPQLRSLREAAATASRQLDGLANQINNLPDGEVQIRINQDVQSGVNFAEAGPRPSYDGGLRGVDNALAESIRGAGSPRTRLAALRPILTEGSLAGRFSGINLQGRDTDVLRRLASDPRVRNLLGGSATAITESLSEGRSGGAGARGSVAEALRDLNLQADKAGADGGAEGAYADALKRIRDAATNAQGSVASLAAEEEARIAVARRLTREMDLAIKTMVRETATNDTLAGAFMQSNEAGRQAEITSRAVTEARKYAREEDANYAEVVGQLRVKIEALDNSERSLAMARQVGTGRNEIEVLQLEGQLITTNVAARNAEVAVLRARQQFIGQDTSALEAQIRQTEQLRSRNEQLTNSWTEVSRLGEQAFERIGSAITEAFAQGKIDGINFKNIMKSVFSEVAQAALKMAVINPILNAAFGGTRGTLGGVFGALGYGGSGIAGLSDSVAAGAPGSVVVNGMNYVAAGQQGLQQAGLLSAGRMTGLGSAFTGGSSATGYGIIDSALNANVWGNTGTGVILGAGEGTSSAANALAGATTYAPGTTGAGLSGLNVGGAIGGAAGIAGGAYGIYSGLQKGGVGGGFQVAGGAASAGLGLTALIAGAAAVPVYGWIAAAILSIAGALLPGQKASGMGQTAYENVDTGAVSSVGLGGKRYSKANLDNSKSAAGQIADLAREIGSRLGGAQFGSSVAVGTTNSTLYLDVAGRKQQFSNNEEGSKQLAEAAARFVIQQFRDENRATGDYAKILNNSPDDVTKLTENLDWYEQVYKTFNETAEGTTPIISAFQQSLDSLNAQFQVSIDRANSLELSTENINIARQKEIDKLEAQRWLQAGTFDQGMQIRLARAQGNNYAADLFEFDIAAQAQLEQNKKALEDLGLSGDELTKRITQNEYIISQERLLVEQKYATEATAAADALADAASAAAEAAKALEDLRIQAERNAANSLSGLVSYTRGLSFGDASTLTSQSKYELALGQFNTVSSAARMGDASSISNLQSYSEQLLSSGRDMFGSGAGYASLFDQVLSTLTGVANLESDTLTASFMAQIQETSTMTLAGELQALRAEVVGLRTQVAQQQSTPARATA